LFGGVTRTDAWEQIAREVGGRFLPGGFLSDPRVQAVAGDWILTLDSTTIGKVAYTRLRAPFVNRDGLQFTIYHADFFTEIGKMFGMQDIEVLHPFFDRRFVVQGNNPHKIRALLQNHRIRAALQAQQTVLFTIRPDEGGFLAPHYPDGVDQLLFLHQGAVTDLLALRALFDLFAETLHTLCHLDSAYKDDWALHVETLNGPGGVIRSGDLVIWDGDVARQRAAQALGPLGEPRAVGPLLTALRDANPNVAASAAWALSALGDPSAAPALIPLLGDLRMAGDQTVAAVAATALRHLGYPEAARRFSLALEGDPQALVEVNTADRPWYIAGLRQALDAEHPPVVRHAAGALARLGAVETLPALRKAARRPANSALAADLDAAIQALQERTRLPRPAAAPAPTAADLPRPADAAPTDSHTLPRPAAPGER